MSNFDSTVCVNDDFADDLILLVLKYLQMKEGEGVKKVSAKEIMDALAADEKRPWSIDAIFAVILTMPESDLVDVEGKEVFANYSVDYETTDFEPLNKVTFSLTPAGYVYLETADKNLDSDLPGIELEEQYDATEEGVEKLDLPESSSTDKSNADEFNPGVIRRILQYMRERRRKGDRLILRDDIIAQLVEVENYNADCVRANIEELIDGGLMQYELDGDFVQYELDENHKYRITEATPVFIHDFGNKFLDLAEDTELWARAVEQTSNIPNLSMLLYALREVSQRRYREQIEQEIKDSIIPKELYLESSDDIKKEEYWGKAKFCEYDLYRLLTYFIDNTDFDLQIGGFSVDSGKITNRSNGKVKYQYKDKDTKIIVSAYREAARAEKKVTLSRQLIKALNHKHPNAPFRFWQKCEKKRKQYLKALAKKGKALKKQEEKFRKEQVRSKARLLSYKGSLIDPDNFRYMLNRIHFDTLARSTEPCVHIKDIPELVLQTLPVSGTFSDAKSILSTVYGAILNDFGFVEWFRDWRKVLRDEDDKLGQILDLGSKYKLSKEICGIVKVTQNGIEFLHYAADEKLWNKAKKMCRGGSFGSFCSVLRFLNVKKSRSLFGRRKLKKALTIYTELEKATKMRYRKPKVEQNEQKQK